MEKKTKIEFINDSEEVNETELLIPIESEDIDDEDEELDQEQRTTKYPRKMFGSGVKTWTPVKQAQCPLCKRYYKRVNEAHLVSIHHMTIADLALTNPELVPFFTEKDYAVENSDYAKIRALANPVIAPVTEETNYIAGEGLTIETFLDEKETFLSKVSENFGYMLDNICEYFNIDRNDPNFTDTPKRVAKAFLEKLKGEKDTDSQLSEIFKDASIFPSSYSGIIVETNIKTYSSCPHHFENIDYSIHIGYKARSKKVGLSKLARCAEILSARLVLQESLTDDIADAIMKYLDAEGCIVVIEGVHNCMKVRGAKQSDVVTTTTSLRGVCLYNHDIKEEFYRIIERNRK